MSNTRTLVPPKKSIRCYIDEDLLRRYREQFPMTNALSWALETSLEELLKLRDGSPPILEEIRQAMRNAVLTQRLRAKRAREDAKRAAETTTERTDVTGPAVGQRVTVTKIDD